MKSYVWNIVMIIHVFVCINFSNFKCFNQEEGSFSSYMWFFSLIGNILNIELRPLPPLPDLDVSEETFIAVAEVMCSWGNRALSIARDIAIGGDLKVLLQVYNLILTYIKINYFSICANWSVTHEQDVGWFIRLSLAYG